jgi:hypothetical protein
MILQILTGSQHHDMQDYPKLGQTLQYKMKPLAYILPWIIKYCLIL